MIRRLLETLALIGRFGTQGFAVSLFVGLGLPQLAAAARPLLGACIFSFVVMTFMRVDPSTLLRLIRRPGVLILTWICLAAVPVAVVAATIAVIGRQNLDPGLVLGFAALAAAPPLMSAPAIAMLLKIEPTLILTAVLLITVLSLPVSPVVVSAIARAAVSLDVFALLWRLVVARRRRHSDRGHSAPVP